MIVVTAAVELVAERDAPLRRDGVAQAVQQVARFLRQDRALIADLMTKVAFRMNLTPDSVANIQLAIDQLRGMNRLDRPVTTTEVIWADPLRWVAPDRVRI